MRTIYALAALALLAKIAWRVVTNPLVAFALLSVVMFALLVATGADGETITGTAGILALALVARLYRRAKDA